MQLGKATRITCGDAAPSATSDVVGTGIDMANHEGAVFVAKIDAASPDITLKLQQASQADFSDAVDLPGATVSSDGTSTTLILDIHKPYQNRYLRPVVERGTAAAVAAITVVRYCPRTKPVDNGEPADNSFAAIVSPELD